MEKTTDRRGPKPPSTALVPIVVRPGAPSSVLAPFVAMPFAPSRVLYPRFTSSAKGHSPPLRTSIGRIAAWVSRICTPPNQRNSQTLPLGRSSLVYSSKEADDAKKRTQNNMWTHVEVSQVVQKSLGCQGARTPFLSFSYLLSSPRACLV